MTQRSPAEEARTLVAGTTSAALATLSEDGAPWASQVTFAALGDGAPVLCVSTLAEHGRNLARDARASIVVAEPGHEGGDPLDRGRVTLAGIAERPAGGRAEAARAAYMDAVSAAGNYVDYGDFSFWVLRVQRVRWVGGYGRMQTVDADDYATAQPDPVAPAAAGAIAHLNADHADALLSMARALPGHATASSARCAGADRYGLDLVVDGETPARVVFRDPCDALDGLRAATVELARRAREPLE